MDWPLTGAVAGVAVLAGAVSFGAMVALRTTPEPVKKPPTFVLLLAPPAGTPGLHHRKSSFGHRRRSADRVASIGQAYLSPRTEGNDRRTTRGKTRQKR